MKTGTAHILSETLKRYPALKTVEKEMKATFEILKRSFEEGGRLYVCGNGGSAADSEHIAGELLKSFRFSRAPDAGYRESLKRYGREGEILAKNLEGGLPVISLCGHPAFATAYANDKEPYLIFAQQVCVLGAEKDLLLAISTSGNSKNCIYAAIAAKAKKMHVIYLGGGKGGRLKEIADVSIIIPETETYKVQELHLPSYHCLCAMLENEFFGVK